MTQIHIDEVYPKEHMYPIIVNFQNGYLSEKSRANECMLFENPENSVRTLVTAIDQVVYAGEEKTEQHGKTYLVARNKKTGKVRLIESGVAELQPVLKAKHIPVQPELSNLELSRKFGSKKQKQRMEQREKLKVDVVTVELQMHNVTKDVSKDELDLSEYDKSNSDDFYIPPINRAAKTVEEVYDIDTILTNEQYEKIHSELDGKDFAAQMVPLVKNILSKNKLPPKLVTLAVYANSLLILYNTLMKEVSKKAFVICPHSVTLNDIILSKFLTVSSGRRTRSSPYKDKSMCHMIVFLMLINNYKIELEALCEALKLTATTASTKVRVTGASVVTSGNKKFVQLKLPLNNKPAFRRKSTRF